MRHFAAAATPLGLPAMTDHDHTDDVRIEFLERLRRDQAAGVVRDLAYYHALFPGFERVIAQEWEGGDRARGGSTFAVFGEPRLPPVAAQTAGAVEFHEPTGRVSQDGGRGFGPYRLLKHLGRGGQGDVWLATDTRLPGRHLAIKILNRRDPILLERFRREALAASLIRHPGICTIYEFSIDGETPFLAMEYIAGQSLGDHIRTARIHRTPGSTTSGIRMEEGPRPSPDAAEARAKTSDPARTLADLDRVFRIVHLIEQVARAIHEAHEKNLVHRDIKPDNILVRDGTFEPVIVDFGLAHHDELTALTEAGQFLGSLPYMSPEQLTWNLIRPDRRADVWSLGVTLYECLTTERPFDRADQPGTALAIQAEPPPDPRQLNPTIPLPLRVVIQKALAKHPAHRYATAGALAEDLRRVREREPILAKPPGPLLRLWLWSHRNPALAAALCAVFVALGLTSYFLVESEIVRGEKEIALTAKAAALTDYDRLGDLSRLQQLTAAADDLWPAEPLKAQAMEEWLKQARSLEANLPGHRGALARLREAPDLLPWSDADRAKDLAAHASEQAEIMKLAAERDVRRASLAVAESRATTRPGASQPAAESAPKWKPTTRPLAASITDLKSDLGKVEARIAELDARAHERRTYRFGSNTALQFKHDTTAKLVEGMTAFVDPKKGLLADVGGRLAFAESVKRETIEKYKAKWDAAIAAIKAEPKYGGLEITEQLGLIPIEPDPDSGLWEFAHLQTTTPGVDPIPKRDARKRLIITKDTGLIFVLLPGGTFRMGAQRRDPTDDTMSDSDPNIDPEAQDTESPVHEVTLDAFFVSKYEMTQGQWLRIAGRNPSSYTSDTWSDVGLTNPVEQVSWEDCAGSSGWLTRLGLRLPTEAQWEYAARGGTTTRWWSGRDLAAVASAGNVCDQAFRIASSNRGVETWNDRFVVHAPVDSFAPNRFGLHDVIGNVWEWCEDAWHNNYSGAPVDGSAWTVLAPRYRVGRGGSFNDDASFARSACRCYNTPEYRGDQLGVRPARGVTP